MLFGVVKVEASDKMKKEKFSMRNFKKLIITLLGITALAISLSGCSGTQQAASEENTANTGIVNLKSNQRYRIENTIPVNVRSIPAYFTG